MPEGPELHLASRFINQVCNGRIFGKVVKSEISKNPVVDPPSSAFFITASSRGKEIKLTLHEHFGKTSKPKQVNQKSLDVLVTFGLAGKFEFVKPEDLAKHAHLNFYTADKEQDMVLSFVDYMRFGKWTPGSDFSFKDRGPCVLTDYAAFSKHIKEKQCPNSNGKCPNSNGYILDKLLLSNRLFKIFMSCPVKLQDIHVREHVLKNLSSSAFNRPICELLLNQKYFNGIGNYLRAEILHRAGIPPFVCGRSVLEPLAGETVVKSENPDILELCHRLPNEVLALEGSWYDAKDRENLSNAFNAWLQCYYQDDMKNMADHNKRTIWYSGPAGPMAPKEQVVRGKIKRKPRQKKKKESESDEEENDTEEGSPEKQSKKKTNEKIVKTKSPKKRAKIEKDIVENEVNEVKSRKRSATKKMNMTAIKELTDNLHGTRLTRRKLKDIIEGSENFDNDGVNVECKVKLESSNNNESDVKVVTNGVAKKGRKRGRSAKKVLNNDAPYLNSSKV